MNYRGYGSSIFGMFALLCGLAWLTAPAHAASYSPVWITTIGGGLYGKGTLYIEFGHDTMAEYDFCAQTNCYDGANPEGGLLYAFAPVATPDFKVGYTPLYQFCLDAGGTVSLVLAK